MLSQSDAALIAADPALLPPKLLRQLCADYDWALRELGRKQRVLQRLEFHLIAYQTWLKSFMEVCPPPEDEKSNRELVEKLLKGVYT